MYDFDPNESHLDFLCRLYKLVHRRPCTGRPLAIARAIASLRTLEGWPWNTVSSFLLMDEDLLQTLDADDLWIHDDDKPITYTLVPFWPQYEDALEAVDTPTADAMTAAILVVRP